MNPQEVITDGSINLYEMLEIHESTKVEILIHRITLTIHSDSESDLPMSRMKLS